MRIPFRQGLIKVNQSSFLNVKSTFVDLVVGDSPLLLTLSAGSKDYLWAESTTVVNAWGPFTTGQDCWLYWDIDARTAVRTFGVTTSAPVSSSVLPSSPVLNQHWYDSTSKQMKVWVGSSWQAKNRVFACKLANGSVPVSLSTNAPSFTGTQVGDSSQVFAGHIVYDASNLPIKDNSGKFLTTEDRLRTKISSTADVKLASILLEARAGQNLAKYTIVRFSDFGQIIAATSTASSGPGQFGIIESDVIVDNLINVVTGGVITNLDWDWTSVGVNTPLFCDDNGVLTATPLFVGQHPVACVVDTHSIQLGASNITVVESTTIIEVDATPATEIAMGIAQLNIAAAVTSQPIVVGANDPRLTDARVPLSHDHEIDDIIDLQDALDLRVSKSGSTMTGVLTLAGAPSGDLHAATKLYVDQSVATTTSSLTNLLVAKAGGTMTGFLVLNGAPTSNLHAATKLYVDSAVDDALATVVLKSGSTMTGALILNDDPINALGAATKQYVDNITDGITLTSLTGSAGAAGQNLSSLGNGSYEWQTNIAEVIYQLACSDLITAITVSTTKAYFRVPRETALTSLRFSLLTASTSGAMQVSVSRNGVALPNSPYTIAALSKTATVDMTAHDITFSADDEIIFGVTSAGTAAKGLIATIIGTE